jgi:ornithine carbamoyltransferase
MKKRDLLTMWDLTQGEILALIRRAVELKAGRAQRRLPPLLSGRMLVMIFEKPSTRTRVSFEVAMVELGGHAVSLAPEASQIGRGEPLSDTARVLGGYGHGIMMRTFAQSRLEELARWSPVPVINGLTDSAHPCQVMADLLTLFEVFADRFAGLKCAYIGDGNNYAHSWIEAAAILGMDLALACPEGYDPDAAILARAHATGRGRISVVRSPAEAARGRDVLITDVWASMGQEAEQKKREQAFVGFTVDEKLLALAAPGAKVMHDLPAHRGEEIAGAVMEGPQSIIFPQAENRLHAQKAILELLLQ